MNEKFLNQTGLAYYHDRAKTQFENKIEKVKVNGTEQIITNKEVDLAVPNVTAGDKSITVNIPDNSKGFYLEQKAGGVEFGGTHADGDFGTVILTDKNYVDNNSGKIDKIKVNGTEQTITNKEVDLLVPEMRAQGSQLNVNGAGMQVNDADDYLKIIKSANGVRLDAFHLGSSGAPASGITNLTIPDKDYVDSKGSIAIDSSLNNKTTFTNGTSTSSIATSPDGIIYTEGAVATEVPSKAYVDDAIAGVTGMEFVIVPELPTEGQKGKIYLLGNGTAGSNVYDEYIWIQDGPNGRFEKIGSTDVDLSNYYNTTNLVAITTTEIDTLFA